MTLLDIDTIAVLDDDETDRDFAVWAVEAAGYEAFIVPDMLSLDEAVTQIRENAQALVSDHNLQWGAKADFLGAEIVTRCYKEAIPAVLVTGYMSDIATSIRQYRRGVAELVARGDLDGSRLQEALESIVAELEGRVDATRVPHRALIRVDRLNREGQQADVVVPQWNTKEKVSIPVSLLGIDIENLADDEVIGQRFFGNVNTGAESSIDLFFEDLEPAGSVPDDSEFE